MFNLRGKVCVLFGGSGYLGRRFCKTLLEHNAIVYNCDIKKTRLKLNKDERAKYKFLKIDYDDKDVYKRCASKIYKEVEKIDVLINSVTAKPHDFYQPFTEVSLEGWEVGLHGNLTVPFLTCQAFIPYMKKNGQGSIINISSIYGIVANDQRIYEGSNLNKIYVDDEDSLKANQVYSHGVYNASKGGLIMFSKYLAAYYGKDNIRVNIITPGGVQHEKENEEFIKKYSYKTPLGRKAKPKEVNGAIIYLASDASSYVTGHNLVIDGGYSIW